MNYLSPKASKTIVGSNEKIFRSIFLTSSVKRPYDQFHSPSRDIYEGREKAILLSRYPCSQDTPRQTHRAPIVLGLATVNKKESIGQWGWDTNQKEVGRLNQLIQKVDRHLGKSSKANGGIFRLNGQ